MSFFTDIRDTVENIAPTALGYIYGGAAGGSLAGQLAAPFEAKSAQTGPMADIRNAADLGLGLYGAYQGISGKGNPMAPYWQQPGATGGAPSWAMGMNAGPAPASATPGGVPGAPGAPGGGTPGSAWWKALPLISGVMGSYQTGQANRAAMDRLNALGAPQREMANQMLAQYKSGTLAPGQQAQIDQWKQSAKAQAQDYFSKAGLSDSDQARAAMAQIDQQAVAMKQSYLDNMLQTGLQQLGITDQRTANAIMAEMQASQSAAQQNAQFLNAYAQFLSPGQQPAQPAAPAAPAAQPVAPASPA